MMWRNPFGRRSTQSTFFSQNDQNAPSQPRVERRSKLLQNNTFHSFKSNSSFSEIFGNFDQVDLELTLASPRNPNFDPTVRTG